MALMINSPVAAVGGQVSSAGLNRPTGGRSFGLPNSAPGVSSYSSQNSDLMSLFADARYNSEQYNSAEAEKNRKWQEYMSNTAHQREVKDLLAAGLNPILSVTGGSGASTPTGSEAQLADNSASIMSLMGAMMSAGAVVGAAAINANSALSVANINANKTFEGVAASRLSSVLDSLSSAFTQKATAPWRRN